MNASPEIEKLFLKYLSDMGKTPGGIFGGFISPKIIEEGNPKEIGQMIQIGADFIESRMEDIEFQSYEYELGKTRSRLIEALNIYREMGKEMQNMTEDEPKEYHWYILAILMDIISSLFNHIEIYITEHPR